MADHRAMIRIAKNIPDVPEEIRAWAEYIRSLMILRTDWDGLQITFHRDGPTTYDVQEKIDG